MPVLPLLLGLFIVVPIVELYIIIQVGQEIGALPTVLVLVAISILGGVLMRSQGRTTWRRFNAALSRGRPPAREVLDGAFVLVGGALLLTPGFATDVLGMACLLPPTRAVLRRTIVRAGLRRVTILAPGGRHGRFDDPDIEGTAREVDR